MWTYTFCILATFASIALQPGYGLRCYICSNENESRCGDPFDEIEERNRPYVRPYEPVECDDNRSPTPHLHSVQPSCKKVVQTNEITGKTVIERSCAWAAPDVDPCGRRQMKYNHKLEHCSLCNEDGCNGASTNVIATIALIASILVAKYLA